MPTSVRLQSGQLRHKANLQSLQGSGKGTRGQSQRAWTNFAVNIPCEITPLSGREREIANQLFPSATHRVTCRYIKGASQKMRWTGLTLGERELNIEQVLNVDELNRVLVMTCGEATT